MIFEILTYGFERLNLALPPASPLDVRSSFLVDSFGGNLVRPWFPHGDSFGTMLVPLTQGFRNYRARNPHPECEIRLSWEMLKHISRRVLAGGLTPSTLAKGPRRASPVEPQCRDLGGAPL